MRFNEKYRSQIIFAAAFLMWFSIYSYQSNFTPYMESLAFSPAMIGLVIGSYGLTQMLLRIPFGVLSDKLGTRKLFIIIGVAFTSLSALVLFFFDNVFIVLFARASAGVASSTWVSFMVLNSSYHDKEKTVKAVGTLEFFSGTGQLGGIIAGSLLVGFTIWKDKSAFALALAVGLAAFVLSFAIYEDKEKLKQSQNKTPIEKKDRPKLAKILSDKNLLIVSAIGMISQLITFGTIFGFTPAYAKEVLKIGEFQNGILMVVSYLPTAFGALFLGRFLIGRIKEHNLVFVGMLTLGAATISIPFISYYPLLVISQAAAGIGKGISFPLLMGLSIKKIPENARGTAMGIFQAVYGFGMFLGPFGVGLIKEHFELGAAFVLLGAICFVCSLISYFSLKKLDL
ncbi:MAG: MFS transporter [Oscillospiraceae bacterium]|nr:MFS transporter [Oscillospiraceae bacterium]